MTLVRSLQADGLAACDKEGCGIVRERRYMAICSEVLRNPIGQGINVFLDFCPDCAPPWTQHTNTNGEERYYLHHERAPGQMPHGIMAEVDKMGMLL